MAGRRTSRSRAKANEPAAIQARYDAASTGRRAAGWQAPSSGPITATAGLQKIRDRARDMERNDWSGESAVQHWTTNLVGIGITPRFKRISSPQRRKEIADLFADFVQQADADGVLNLFGLQTLAVRGWLSGGEMFVRRRVRANDAPLAVPLQVQLIEPEFIPMLDTNVMSGLPIGNTIRQGIERNKYGRRVAYWMYREHPAEKTTLASIDPSKLLRVPAEDVCHIYEPKRAGQLRGVPAGAPVMMRQRTTNDYDDAVAERMRLANLFVAFLTKSLPQGFDDGTDPLTGQRYDTDANGQAMIGLEPGQFQELAPGEDVKFSNPPEAGTTYSEYMRTQHLGTSAGWGLPYELFSGDIANVSDRTLRVTINEFRRYAEQRQWQIIIPQMCQPIVQWFAEASLLAGKISTAEFDLVVRAEHAPHGWQYIHPVQDVQGKALEVSSGFRSRSSVVAQQGDDAEAVDEERAADKEREDRLGLTPEPPQQNVAGPGDANPNQPQGPQP